MTKLDTHKFSYSSHMCRKHFPTVFQRGGGKSKRNYSWPIVGWGVELGSGPELPFV